jgi:hypothetical protein
LSTPFEERTGYTGEDLNSYDYSIFENKNNSIPVTYTYDSVLPVLERIANEYSNNPELATKIQEYYDATKNPDYQYISDYFAENNTILDTLTDIITSQDSTLDPDSVWKALESSFINAPLLDENFEYVIK